MNTTIAKAIFTQTMELLHNATIRNVHADDYVSKEKLVTVIEEITGEHQGKKITREALLKMVTELHNEAAAELEKQKEEVVSTEAGDFGGDRYYPGLQEDSVEEEIELPVTCTPTEKKKGLENVILMAIHKAMFAATFNGQPVHYIKNKALFTIIQYNLPKELRNAENMKKVLDGMCKKKIIAPIKGRDFCCVVA